VDLRLDVIVAQHTIAAVAAARLGARLGVPVVLNYLDFLTGFMETWPAPFTRSGLVGALTRFEVNLPRRCHADGVMTVSAPLADRIAATGYPRDRLEPIQYGYDARWFRPPDRVLAGPPVVAMHGSFDTHHLGPIARGAMARVHAARPDATFRFVGKVTPGLASFVAGARAVHPGIRIETPGFVGYRDVASLLGDASVGIVPYEASNGTHCAFVAKAVEYLGCGVPVASTPLENLTRYFKDEPAIRFSGFDAESFAAAILDRLALPAAERTRIGAAASARVARELDWPVIARRAADFVEACTARRAGSTSARSGTP
jgi:glycosyltransferase involved in cell wall biosynthesis